MSDKTLDWYMDRVLFLPMNIAKGQSEIVKVFAVVAYPAWFAVFAVLGLPLLACATLSEVYRSLK